MGVCTRQTKGRLPLIGNIYDNNVIVFLNFIELLENFAL